jgi:hypothetical protein
MTIHPLASPLSVAARPELTGGHVATLDNDAPQIFAESADFVARVSAG